MHKKKIHIRKIFLLLIMTVFPAILSGCGRKPIFADSKWHDIREVTEKILAQATERVKEQSSKENAPEPETVQVPQLTMKGGQLSDFVPAGWELMDSVELDFNRDKVMDYVGVLNVLWQEDGKYDYWNCPRILFAVESSENGQYQLSFQDENLIRNSNEGGVFGDPYLPLTAEDASFTTHSFGGSAWKWSEDYTYSYKEGTWYLTKSESTYGYGPYITSYEANDWETGIGIRKERSDDFNEMEKHWDEEPVYDTVYELSLDEMPTIYQAGKRWWLAPDRITDWEVKSVTFAEGITGIASEENIGISDNSGLVSKIKESLGKAYIEYNDENCILYTYSDKDSPEKYLVMYRLQDKTLSVLVQSEVSIDDLEMYQGKVYYTTEIVENVTYKTMKEGTETIVQEEDVVGLILHRMNADGSGEETIFEYRHPAANQEILDSRPPYLAFIYEISGGEIVLKVYGGEGEPIYRMNTDGSNVRQIGQAG